MDTRTKTQIVKRSRDCRRREDEPCHRRTVEKCGIGGIEPKRLLGLPLPHVPHPAFGVLLVTLGVEIEPETMFLAVAQSYGAIDEVENRVALFSKRINVQLRTPRWLGLTVGVEREVLGFELEDVLADDVTIVR